MQPFSLNIRGRLIEYSRPVVMGILNVTPDSFYQESRVADFEDAKSRTALLRAEGADIIDVGGYSTRPGSSSVSEDEEWRRVSTAIEAVKSEWSEAVVSVDTFRASIARRAVEEAGADIVNDITGGAGDAEMFHTVAALKVPYVLTHCHGTTPAAIQQPHLYHDFATEVVKELAEKVSALQLLGVNDLIIDPGFGFSKTVEENYELLFMLPVLQVFHLPLLCGVSRKSMITKVLGVDAEDALIGTTALHTLLLERGASILRVHDVKAACQTVKIIEKAKTIESYKPC